ncbi:uncharacterized protein LOC114339036 [Diabrotica virgifera virgifera]|uniref:Uncharacterized protein n=1 Tax=Diabrotica virgifera virgifera TaxID=50390 RepID=A0ABM5IWJ9_DIAVI|nr:uncharacterized protein LOC114339036 [Diabrotica virgifera virgifera]
MNLVEQCFLLLAVFASVSFGEERNISISTFDFKEANDSLWQLIKEPYKFTKLINEEILKQFEDKGYVPTERQLKNLTKFTDDIRQLITTVRKLLKDMLPPIIQILYNAVLNVIRRILGSEAQQHIKRITDFLSEIFHWKLN